jgi:hypothetical protein
MSVVDKLIHSIEVWHPTFDEDDRDERGQPAVSYGDEPVASVRGLVDPKTAREVQLLSEAGPVVADHTIHLMLPLELSERDRLDRVIGETRISYEVVGIRRFDFGSFPHLEVDAKRYTAESSEPEEEGS